MNKYLIKKTLDYGIPVLMLIILGLLVYIWFFSTDNFCVGLRGQADQEDLEPKCFAKITEANEYKAEMVAKYKLNETFEPQYGSYTFNIS